MNWTQKSATEWTCGPYTIVAARMNSSRTGVMFWTYWRNPHGLVLGMDGAPYFEGAKSICEAHHTRLLEATGTAAA